MLYLDSADPTLLRDVLPTGLFGGITTSPRVLHRSGAGVEHLPQVYATAVDSGAQLVFVQAMGDSVDEILHAASDIVNLGEHARVKVGCSQAGVTAVRHLAAEGLEVMLTSVFHPAQTLLALSAGARWICPQINRAAGVGIPVEQLIGESAAMIQRAGSPLRIVAGSLVSLDQTALAASQGAQDQSLGPDLAELLLNEPDTVESLIELASLQRSR